MVNGGKGGCVGSRTGRMAESREVLVNLLGLVLIVALIFVGIAYGIDALSRAQDQGTTASGNQARVSVNISGVALSVPAADVRRGSGTGATFSDRVDLALTLDLAEAAPLPITMSLVPKARAQASAALLDSVFLKRFSAEEKRGAPGLVGKPLVGGDGYDGETVWYDPIGIDPFTAKCAPPLPGESSGACVRTLVLDSGLSAVLDFSEAALHHWRQFDAPLRAYLADIGAGTPVR